MNDIADYMLSRRSALSLALTEPGPSEEQLRTMVQIGARVPDHGKLAPWRFVHWSMEARRNIHRDLAGLLAARADVHDRAKLEKGTDKLLHGPAMIMVVSTAGEHPKIPEWEQILSGGAACMNLLIAANSMGFEAQWLTAWYVYDDEARDILQLEPGERVAGLIHIGSSQTPKSERPRPEIDTIFTQRST